MDKPQVVIYSDGGADPNPGPGGWGAVLLFENDGATHKKELRGGNVQTTNNRMELTAALEALRVLKQPCIIDFFTDSQYLQKGITEWITSWKKTNFKKGTIQNADLWQLLDTEASKHEIHWQWVKGHANNEYNERADVLAEIGRAEAMGQPLSDETIVEPYRIYLKGSGAYDTVPGLWTTLLEKEGKQTILSGQELHAATQRLSLLAAIAGLEALPEKEAVHIFTSSDYLRDGIRGWVKGWKQNGWRTKDGSEVKHRDLWERLDKLTESRRIKLSAIDDEDPHLKLLADNLKQSKKTLLDD